MLTLAVTRQRLPLAHPHGQHITAQAMRGVCARADQSHYQGWDKVGTRWVQGKCKASGSRNLKSEQSPPAARFPAQLLSRVRLAADSQEARMAPRVVSIRWPPR